MPRVLGRITSGSPDGMIAHVSAIEGAQAAPLDIETSNISPNTGTHVVWSAAIAASTTMEFDVSLRCTTYSGKSIVGVMSCTVQRIGSAAPTILTQGPGFPYYNTISDPVFVLNSNTLELRLPSDSTETIVLRGSHTAKTTSTSGDPAPTGTLYLACSSTVKQVAKSNGSVIATTASTGDSVDVCHVGGNAYALDNAGTRVLRISSATGAVTGTCSVGTSPLGICSDGTYLYVTNSGDGTVTRIAISTFTVDGSPVSVGAGPYGIAWDHGSYIYVCTSGTTSLARIRISDFTVTDHPAATGNPRFVCWDGAAEMVSVNTGGELNRTTISTGTHAGYFYTTSPAAAYSVAADDLGYLYVVDHGSGVVTVTKIAVSNHAIVTAYTLAAQGTMIAFDGSSHMWISHATDRLSRISTITGTIETYTGAGYTAKGIAWDGA